MNCEPNWPRADSKQSTSLQHSDRKCELHSAGHRRRESVWTHGSWERQANSRVLKTRGESGVQCSGVTLAQRCHDCRSESRNADLKRHDLGGRRSGSIGTAPLDDAHGLQGSSSEHRVPGS